MWDRNDSVVAGQRQRKKFDMAEVYHSIPKLKKKPVVNYLQIGVDFINSHYKSDSEMFDYLLKYLFYIEMLREGRKAEFKEKLKLKLKAKETDVTYLQKGLDELSNMTFESEEYKKVFDYLFYLNKLRNERWIQEAGYKQGV